MKGSFCTKVGREETRNEWQDTWFKVVGFLNGPFISFIVNYDATEAISSNIGAIETHGVNLVMPVKGYFIAQVPEGQKWRQVAATSCTYTKAI